MDTSPTCRPYPCPDLTTVNVQIKPWLKAAEHKEDKTWKTLGKLSLTESYELMDTIRSRLKMFVDPKSGFRPGANDPQLSAFFSTADLHNLEQDICYKNMLDGIESTGLAFIDTKLTDQEILKQLGCHPRSAMGTVEIVQVADIYGNTCLFRTLYDCRHAHMCHCTQPCREKFACPTIKTNLNHNFWESREEYRIYGIELPRKVIDIFEDSSVFKIQSAIVSSGGNWGDVERIEAMTGCKFRSFIEVQSLVTLIYPQEGPQRRFGMEFLCDKLLVEPPEKVLREVDSPKRRSNLIERRKDWSLFTLAERYYDLVDVAIPALLCLQLGTLICDREETVTYDTNMLPYLREILFVYRDEPNHAVNKSNYLNPDRFWPFKENFENFGADDAAFLEHSNFAWRPGVEMKNFSVFGPKITRNLRQLAMDIAGDAYGIPLDRKQLHQLYLPEEDIPAVQQAMKVWKGATSITPPAVVHFSGGGPSQSFVASGRFHTRDKLAFKRKYDPAHYKELKGKKSCLSRQAVGTKKHKPLNHTTTKNVVYYGFCGKCGGRSHIAKDCEERNKDLWKEGGPKCRYPLCRRKKESRHSVEVCDHLHHICEACKFRGHRHEDHQDFDLVSLELIFRAWAPYGSYTSLPYLDGATFWRKPTPEEFRFGFFNQAKGSNLHEKHQ